jgi:hypothetical protein
MSRLEAAMYHYGLRAGLPFDFVDGIANAGRVASEPTDYLQRRQEARARAHSPWAGFISRERGYALVGPDTLPGQREVVEEARRLIEARKSESGVRGEKKNPFRFLERPEDFSGRSRLVDFALSAPVIDALCGYYGLVPQLKSIGLWITTPLDKATFGSQLYHLDKPEVGIVGLFINVSAVTPKNGPLTAIPADVSRDIVRSTQYAHRYYLSDGRLHDDEMKINGREPETIALAGPPGTGAFVDTSSCLHFGSRCIAGERQMLVFKYMRAHRARDRRTVEFDGYSGPLDRLGRLVLSGARLPH